MPAECVAVIGAGPAGRAAARTLVSAGVAVWVFDEQPRSGGNVGRVRVDAPATALEQLAADSANLHLLGDARVLQLGAGGVVEYQQAGVFRSDHFAAVIVACGAYDTHFPLPGLPAANVTSAGSLQALYKAQGIVPDGAIIIAGSGPFLYVAAADLAAAGARVSAVVDRFRSSDYSRLAGPGLLIPGNGVEYVRRRATLLRHGVQVLRGQTLTAVADNQLRLASGRSLAFDQLGLTELMVPQTQLPRTAGCAQQWSAAGGYYITETDAVGRTSVAGIYVCGEGHGIRGWRHARVSGALTAQACLADAGKAGEPHPGRRVQIFTGFARRLERTMRAREPQQFAPAAIVCACEQVAVKKVQDAVALGLDDLSSIKVVTRCGMGPCQGRYCEPLVARIIEQAGKAPRAPLNQHVLTRPITAQQFAATAPISVAEQA